MSAEAAAAEWIRTYVAQYVRQPSREHDFKVKAPHKGLCKQQQGRKRPLSHISTEADHCADDAPEKEMPLTASKTLSLYRAAILKACSESAQAKAAFAPILAFECRHLCMTAADVVACDEASASMTGALPLVDFLFCPSLPWGGRVAAQLVTLDLEQNALGDLGIQQLCAHVLPRTKHLQRLLLASNHIGASGLARLCAFLLRPGENGRTSLPYLAVLGLTNNDLCAGATPSLAPGKALANVLALYRDSMRRIHLNHVGFKTQDVVDLLATLFAEEEPPKLFCFETVYLKQNREIDLQQVDEHLRNLPFAATQKKNFVTKHLLL